MLASFPVLTILGCKKEEPLLYYISELRQDIFEGKSDDFLLKAHYGFKEEVHLLDNKRENTKYMLTIILDQIPISYYTEYTLNFNYHDIQYTGVFKFNPNSEKLSVNFNINNFTEKEFKVTLSYAGNNKEIPLTSIVPKDTVPYTEILSVLREKQSTLIESLTKDGEFSAEIILRIIVKDEKAYYYVGFYKDNRLKAFLIDGKNKEILTMRDITK